MSKKKQRMNNDELVNRIDNDFAYHPPINTPRANLHDSVRKKTKELALFFVNNCPLSRELSLALTNLEVAMFWANSAIARQQNNEITKDDYEYKQQTQKNNLPTFQDERGKLTVIEDCPFEIKRVFWIYEVPEKQLRAGHKHDLCKQVLICISGSVIVTTSSVTVVLDRPDKMLYLSVDTKITLHHFSDDAVLLVLASEKYDPEDNIS